MSFVNIGELIAGLFSPIMISGFKTDWTQSSLFHCKFRWFCVQLCLLTTFTCLCLATIDQYCATCSYPHWRLFSNIKLARRLCILFVLIFTCGMTNGIFQQYFIYSYTLILTGFLPIFITAVFGILAYRNIQQLAFQTIPLVRRELDKQLTTMVFVQVIFNFLIVILYIVTIILSSQPTMFSKPFVTAQLSQFVYIIYILVFVLQMKNMYYSIYIFYSIQTKYNCS